MQIFLQLPQQAVEPASDTAAAQIDLGHGLLRLIAGKLWREGRRCHDQGCKSCT